MDPGTAIGLAGSAFKLVISAIDFVGDVKKVYEKGGTGVNRDLDTIAKSIQRASDGLEEQLSSNGGRDEVIEETPEDQELRTLAVKAAEIGKELELALKKVLADEKSKLKAFKAVVRGLWSAEDIQQIETRLSGIRASLQLRILVGIREKIENSGQEQFRQMFKILEGVANQHSQSHEDNNRLVEILTENEDLGRSRHCELVMSTQTILNELRAMSSSPQTPGLLPSGGQRLNSDEETRKMRAEAAILASLWYPSMDDREQSISDAYEKTFQWILQDPVESEKPWDSFKDFLEGQAGTYWITGKPASGKSTLMKYLASDEKIKEHLAVWASERELMVSSFYFFYYGPHNQKSELGLLMSLLATLLRKRKDLIPVAFESRFQSTLWSSLPNQAPPSLHEAKTALYTLIKKSPGICFFLTVDGLDEFDPGVSSTDVESLLRLARSLGDLPNAKIVLSSRPLTVFERSMANYPNLRIHEQTRDDITLYVHERLEQQPRMQTLLRANKVQARQLVKSIVESSSGVFLWIRLVVDSLLEGLDNYDDIEDLQRRVNELPQDLHGLYQSILSRVPNYYRSQTAKLLQLVLKGIENGQHISLLGLWFAEREDGKLVFQTPVKPINDDDLTHHTEEMQRRLKSRVRGLIELEVTTQDLNLSHVLTTYPKGDVYNTCDDRLKWKVTFLHRSVVEFLSSEEISRKFVNVPELSRFDASMSIICSAVLVLKTCRAAFVGNEWAVFFKLAQLAIIRCQRSHITDDAKPYFCEVLRELDRTMTIHFTNIKKSLDQMESDRDAYWPKKHTASHWSSCYSAGKPRIEQPAEVPFPRNEEHTSFITFAAGCGLHVYLEEEISRSGPSLLKKEGLPLLGYALHFYWPSSAWSGPSNEETLSLLLRHGFSPNETFNGRTLWACFLQALPYAYNLFSSILPIWVNPTHLSAMILLIKAGADPNAHMIWIGRPSSWKCRDIPEPIECTLLLGLRHAAQAYNSVEETEPSFEYGKRYQEKHQKRAFPMVLEAIKLLEERGAVEEEWKDGVIIHPPKSNTRVLEHTDNKAISSELILSKSNLKDATFNSANTTTEGQSNHDFPEEEANDRDDNLKVVPATMRSASIAVDIEKNRA